MALKGASFSFTELLYSQNGAGNALAGNASAGTATLLAKQSSTSPLPALDQGFMSAGIGVNKSFHVYARGIITTVASSPQTLILGLAYATSDTTTIGTTLCATGAFTTATSLASAVWELECDINATSVGTSGAMQGLGMATVAPTTSSGLSYGMGGSATVAMNTEVANYLQIYGTWGASNASATNTLTCYQFLWIPWN